MFAIKVNIHRDPDLIYNYRTLLYSVFKMILLYIFSEREQDTLETTRSLCCFDRKNVGYVLLFIKKFKPRTVTLHNDILQQKKLLHLIRKSYFYFLSTISYRPLNFITLFSLCMSGVSRPKANVTVYYFHSTSKEQYNPASANQVIYLLSIMPFYFPRDMRSLQKQSF